MRKPKNIIQADREGVKFTPRPPKKPTTALPGTAAKLDIMAERVEKGEELWHPSDIGRYSDD